MRISDWSSDVCSSDLAVVALGGGADAGRGQRVAHPRDLLVRTHQHGNVGGTHRAHAIAAHLRGGGITKLAVFEHAHDLGDGGGDRVIDVVALGTLLLRLVRRSEEHTSELQSLMRNSY